ncbi:hypothetical protein MTBSS4_740003 [Magnetospirillum sp. SS-4]|nr:hypothetical protein MTBSS4_740003 [Magnetospirillum sp. SS-4]
MKARRIMSENLNNVILFPETQVNDPDHYAKPCPKCGGIFYFISLTNKIICENCFVAAEFPDDEI